MGSKVCKSHYRKRFCKTVGGSLFRIEKIQSEREEQDLDHLYIETTDYSLIIRNLQTFEDLYKIIAIIISSSIDPRALISQIDAYRQGANNLNQITDEYGIRAKVESLKQNNSEEEPELPGGLFRRE